MEPPKLDELVLKNRELDQFVWATMVGKVDGMWA